MGTARQVFQLHPSGHLFEAGHVAKLELLPKDSGGGALNSYGRPANGQGDITVSDLDLRLPVLEGPGAAGAQVGAAPPLPLPCGAEIAPLAEAVEHHRELRHEKDDQHRDHDKAGRAEEQRIDHGADGAALEVFLLLGERGDPLQGVLQEAAFAAGADHVGGHLAERAGKPQHRVGQRRALLDLVMNLDQDRLEVLVRSLFAQDGQRLKDRGIVYIPDYAINAGGLINVAQEWQGYDRNKAMERASRIHDTIDQVLQRASAQQLRPEQVADAMVEEKLA